MAANSQLLWSGVVCIFITTVWMHKFIGLMSPNEQEVNHQAIWQENWAHQSLKCFSATLTMFHFWRWSVQHSVSLWRKFPTCLLPSRWRSSLKNSTAYFNWHSWLCIHHKLPLFLPCAPLDMPTKTTVSHIGGDKKQYLMKDHHYEFMRLEFPPQTSKCLLQSSTSIDFDTNKFWFHLKPLLFAKLLKVLSIFCSIS